MPDPKLGKLYDVLMGLDPSIMKGVNKDSFVAAYSDERNLRKLYGYVKSRNWVGDATEEEFLDKFIPERHKRDDGEVSFLDILSPLPYSREQTAAMVKDKSQRTLEENDERMKLAADVLDDARADITRRQEAFIQYKGAAEKVYDQGLDYLKKYHAFDEEKYYTALERVKAASALIKQTGSEAEAQGIRDVIKGDMEYLRALREVPEFNSWIESYKALKRARTLEGRLFPALAEAQERARQTQARTDMLSREGALPYEAIRGDALKSANKAVATVASLAEKVVGLFDEGAARKMRVENYADYRGIEMEVDALKPSKYKGAYKERYLELDGGKIAVLDESNNVAYGRDSHGFIVPLTDDEKKEAWYLAEDGDNIKERRNFRALAGMATPVVSDFITQILLTRGLGALGVTNRTLQVAAPTWFQVMGSYYNEAIEGGMDSKTAFALANSKAILDGFLENIGGLEAKLASVGVPASITKAARVDVRNKVLGGKIASGDLFKEYISYIQSRVPGSALQGFNDVVEEVTQGISGDVMDNLLGGENKDIVKSQIDNIEETALISFGIGSGAMSLKDAADFSDHILVNALDQMVSDRAKADKMIDESVVSEGQKEYLRSLLGRLSATVGDGGGFSSDADRLEAIALSKMIFDAERAGKDAEGLTVRLDEVLQRGRKADEGKQQQQTTAAEQAQTTATVETEEQEQKRILEILESEGVFDVLEDEQDLGGSDGEYVPSFIQAHLISDVIGTDMLVEDEAGEVGRLDIDKDKNVVLVNERGGVKQVRKLPDEDVNLESLGLKPVRVSVQADNVFVVGDKTYVVDSPDTSVVYNEDGSVKSVTATVFSDGQLSGVVLDGAVAEEIAYRIKLKELYDRFESSKKPGRPSDADATGALPKEQTAATEAGAAARVGEVAVGTEFRARDSSPVRYRVSGVSDDGTGTVSYDVIDEATSRVVGSGAWERPVLDNLLRLGVIGDVAGGGGRARGRRTRAQVALDEMKVRNFDDFVAIGRRFLRTGDRVTVEGAGDAVVDSVDGNTVTLTTVDGGNKISVGIDRVYNLDSKQISNSIKDAKVTLEAARKSAISAKNTKDSDSGRKAGEGKVGEKAAAAQAATGLAAGVTGGAVTPPVQPAVVATAGEAAPAPPPSSPPLSPSSPTPTSVPPSPPVAAADADAQTAAPRQQQQRPDDQSTQQPADQGAGRRLYVSSGTELTGDMLDELNEHLAVGGSLPRSGKTVMPGRENSLEAGDVVLYFGEPYVVVSVVSTRGGLDYKLRGRFGNVIKAGVRFRSNQDNIVPVRVDGFGFRVGGLDRAELDRQAANVKSALSKIIPGIEIVFLTGDEYQRRFNPTTRERGRFVRSAGVSTIYINTDLANRYTVLHEAAHAAFVTLFSLNDPRILGFHYSIIEVLRADSTLQPHYGVLIKKLEEHVQKYKDSPDIIKSHEYLAELVALLSSHRAKLHRPIVSNNIIEKVNNFLESLIGIRPFGASDNINSVINFINNLSESLASGKVLNTDISRLYVEDVDINMRQVADNDMMGRLMAALGLHGVAGELSKFARRFTGWSISDGAAQVLRTPRGLVDMVSLRRGAASGLRVVAQSGGAVSLDSVADAPALFRAYPKLRDVRVAVGSVVPGGISIPSDVVSGGSNSDIAAALADGIGRVILRIEGLPADVDSGLKYGRAIVSFVGDGDVGVADPASSVEVSAIVPDRSEEAADAVFASKVGSEEAKLRVLSNISNSHAMGRLPFDARRLYNAAKDKFDAFGITVDDIRKAIGEPVSSFVSAELDDMAAGRGGGGATPTAPTEDEDDVTEDDREYTTFVTKQLESGNLPPQIQAVLRDKGTERIRLSFEDMRLLAEMFIGDAVDMDSLRRVRRRILNTLGNFRAVPKGSVYEGRVSGWQFMALDMLYDRALMLGEDKFAARIKNDIGDLAASYGRLIVSLRALHDKKTNASVLVSRLLRPFSRKGVVGNRDKSPVEEIEEFLATITVSPELLDKFRGLIERAVDDFLFKEGDVVLKAVAGDDPKAKFISYLKNPGKRRPRAVDELVKAWAWYKRKKAAEAKQGADATKDTTDRRSVQDIVSDIVEDINKSRLVINDIQAIMGTIDSQLSSLPANERARLKLEIEDMISDITGIAFGAANMRRLARSSMAEMRNTLVSLALNRAKRVNHANSLFDAIRQASGLDPDAARKFEAVFMDVFNKTLADDMEKIEAKTKIDFLGKKLEAARAELEKAEQAYKSAKGGLERLQAQGDRDKARLTHAKLEKAYRKYVDRVKTPASIMLSIQRGMMSNEDVITKEFLDFYDIPNLTGEDIQRLKGYVDRLDRATRAKDRELIYDEFTDFMNSLASNTPLDYRDALFEFGYVNMLSSPNTVFRAVFGSMKQAVEDFFTTDVLLSIGILFKHPKLALRGGLARALLEGFVNFANTLPDIPRTLFLGHVGANIDAIEAGKLVSHRKQLTIRAQRAFDRFLSALNRDVKGDAKAEGALKKLTSFAHLLNWGQIVFSRGLIVSDILWKAFYTPYVANRLATYEALRSSTEGGAVDLLKATDKMMGYTEELDKAVEEEVALGMASKPSPDDPNVMIPLEGKELETWKKDRKRFLRSEFADQALVSAAADASAMLTLTGTVHGSVGKIINPWIESMKREDTSFGLKLVNFIVLPFARATGLSINLALSALPTNIFQTKIKADGSWDISGGAFQLRKTRRVYKDMDTLESERDLLDYEVFKVWTKALMPSALLSTVLFSLFDFEEEEDALTGEKYIVIKPGSSGYRVTGRDKPPYLKNEAIYGSGWEPYAIQRYNEKLNKWQTVYSYMDGSLGVVLAALGEMSDNIFYNDNIKRRSFPLESLSGLLSGAYYYIGNSGWASSMQSITDIIDAMNFSGKTEERKQELARDRAVDKILRPFTNFGIANYIADFIRDATDTHKIDRMALPVSQVDIPGVDAIGKHIGKTMSYFYYLNDSEVDVETDPIGYPVVTHVFWSPMYDKESAEEKTPRIWKVFRKYPESFGFNHFYLGDRNNEYDEVISGASAEFVYRVKKNAAYTKRRVLENYLEYFERVYGGPYDEAKAKELFKMTNKINRGVNDHVLVENIISLRPDIFTNPNLFLSSEPGFTVGDPGILYSWRKLSDFMQENRLVLTDKGIVYRR